MHILLGDGAGVCSTYGKYGSYFVIDGDGSGYPCDFYGLVEWKSDASSRNASADGQQYNYGKFSTVGSEKPEEYKHCPMADFVMVAARMIGSQMTPEHTTIFVLLSARFWIILSPAYVKSP